MDSPLNINLFYSWQSDLPKETNQRAIELCLKQALLKLENTSSNLKATLDEATRGEVGTPDIPSTIFNKISNADIFLCDVTTINAGSVGRKTPNPNVLIELGYGIGVLGWGRTILVFNKAFGEFPNDLPFDLDKRRVISFTIQNGADKTGKAALVDKLIVAIEAIISKSPTRPKHNTDTESVDIKAQNDLNNLNAIFSCIHIPTIDRYIDELPYRVLKKGFTHHHAFMDIYSPSTFHIYNKELFERISAFAKAWDNTFNYGDIFFPSTDERYYYTPSNVFQHPSVQKRHRKLVKETKELRSAFSELLFYVRENYTHLDINSLSEKAFIDEQA